ncbi:MAG: hypothetical protein JW807_09070 [Spirochaetes bacterium]|nr:hypothetical protein [Spirochaetota bacterium]
MKVYESIAGGGKRESSSKRIKYSVDEKGEIVETYEEISEYSIIVAGTVEEVYADLAEKARERVRRNIASPLEYFMYRSQLEPDSLLALTGFSPREFKKHMKPKVFRTLEDDVLQRYASAFMVDIGTIKKFIG